MVEQGDSKRILPLFKLREMVRENRTAVLLTFVDGGTLWGIMDGLGEFVLIDTAPGTLAEPESLTHEQAEWLTLWRKQAREVGELPCVFKIRVKDEDEGPKVKVIDLDGKGKSNV